ncbi:MAG: tetratricopeptide repeat protein, partial [Candidatus Acidiferrales bacterium]
AYLNTGEKDKALAAFNKGAEMSKTPLIWNDVAFALADQQLDLPKALQYAQSAASTTSANLRNADLAHLTLDDLSNVQSLGAIWDTLGWVYFRQGDLDRAEHYIHSAWLLNEHGEVGDHLAQIYEKRGEKGPAAQTFALAAASEHSIPETRGRLATLLGLDGKDPSIDERIRQARPGLVALRTLAAGKAEDVDGSADFLLLLSPEGKSAKVDDVAFVSGSGKLRPLMDRLRSLDFGAVFPDDSPAKLVRRGTLTCSAKSDKCVFVLALPEDVRTLN